MASTSNEKGAITLATLEKTSLSQEEMADIELRNFSKVFVLRQLAKRQTAALDSREEMLVLTDGQGVETGVFIRCRPGEASNCQYKLLVFLAPERTAAGGND